MRQLLYTGIVPASSLLRPEIFLHLLADDTGQPVRGPNDYWFLYLLRHLPFLRSVPLLGENIPLLRVTCKDQLWVRQPVAEVGPPGQSQVVRHCTPHVNHGAFLPPRDVRSRPAPPRERLAAWPNQVIARVEHDGALRNQDWHRREGVKGLC